MSFPRARMRLVGHGGACAVSLVVCIASSAAALGEPSLIGQTGLINMPDARLAPDGTLRFGVSRSDPYTSTWGSVTLFPRLEISGRYVTIDDVPGFADPDFGDYRDKVLDGKLLLVRESDFIPAVALGTQDFVGTRLFSADYLALSKRFGDFDFTFGFGRDRIDGAFGGVRYAPAALPRWRFILEYDANDYRRDRGADLSGAAQRSRGATYGIEYRYGWLGAQLSYRDDEVDGNVYVAIPLMQREFVPKVDEPPPYDTPTPRASVAAWRTDARYLRTLVAALERQGYRDIRLRLRDDALELSLSHGRISLIGRSVGRAARTALRLGPLDMTRLRITYTENEQPLLTYTFADLGVLMRYFAGTATRAQLMATASVVYPTAELAAQLADAAPMMLDDEDDLARAQTFASDDTRFLAAQRPVGWLSDFTLLPFNLRVFFNDPGAPVRYDTFAVLGYGRRLAPGLFLDSALRLTLIENVSDVRSNADSLLPHVRSDVSEYRREGARLRLNTLLLNKYGVLNERVYGRVSAGYYEEMFAGAGGQVLYFPSAGSWAVDLAVDALRQRAPGEAFGFRDYSIVTALASVHYRFPAYGVTTTARIGRFLAKDEGVRLELKRQFRSGIEIGFWYTRTNEDDITGPGTPDSPYRDKGLFVSIPLNSMLTRDTRDRASLALADYTRDVGQLVASPGDLYRLFEQRLLFGSAQPEPLADFTR